MTKDRRYGEDSPFSAWVRARKDLDSVSASLYVTDIDWVIHRYRTYIDALGTREVQHCMWVEVKTRGAEPPIPQQEILFFHHQILRSRKLRTRPDGRKVAVWHQGCFILQFDGESPADSEALKWGVFQNAGDIKWFRTEGASLADKLAALFRFERDPTDPWNERKFIDTRRHHKETELLLEEGTPIGLRVERKVRFRS